MILTLANKCCCLKGTHWALRTHPAQCAPPSGRRASGVTPGPPVCLAFCVWGSVSHLCSREDLPSAVHTLCTGQPMLCAASVPGHGTDRHSRHRGTRLPPGADCAWNLSVLADSSSVACARDARQSALPLLPFNVGSPPFTECLPPSIPDLKTSLSLWGLASALLAWRPLRSLCESADDPGLYVLSNAISTSLNSSHKAACGAASGSLIWDHLSINLTEDRRPGFWSARRRLPRKKPSRS